MVERTASAVSVKCLEAEGVRYLFGIPDEETLDLRGSLAESTIRCVPGDVMPPLAHPAADGGRMSPGSRRQRRASALAPANSFTNPTPSGVPSPVARS